MANSSSVALQSRPYRSHRVPACGRCRSRKIRCHIDIPGEPCLSCREKRLKCQYLDNSIDLPPGEGGEGSSPFKRRRRTSGEQTDAPQLPHSAPILHKPANHPSASIILPPHVAEDIEILHRHISQNRPAGSDASDPYQTLSHDVKNPVVYLSVPRYRAGLPSGLGAGKEQLEIIEQIMGPFKREVIDLFFNHVHPHFPILDDETYKSLKENPTLKVSRNLMCCIYAIGAPYWKHSETLKLHARPDSFYVWNKAISAVLEDFLSPSLGTVTAAILDQIGRPSSSLLSNVTLCGRTVALAQAFGLHRDPNGWNITELEKSTRLRAWWGVLITDCWSSIAYGTPPLVAKGMYDMPKPDLKSLLGAKATQSQKYASTCFIHLCALTELLGDILPLVYHMGPDPKQLEESAERLLAVLNRLESELPEWLPQPERNGTSNLWFCFLSMRLVLNRVALRAAVLKKDQELERFRLDQLRTASSAVLDFVLSLGETQFNDFWLPYATYLLVQAVTVSLRCTIEAQDQQRQRSIDRLERTMAHIHYAFENYDWDIARHCLDRCADPIAKMAALAAQDVHNHQETQVTTANGVEVANGAEADEVPFLLSDILDPNAFDLSWEALWDTPSGMPNFSI